MERTTALFVDADNVRVTAIPVIVEILKLEWTPIKMRAYGSQIRPRQKILRDCGVLPVEVIPVLPGKNSVDLVLTIDALEELFCGQADSIAIASGDSDFTPLALKIREHGKPILIFGHSFTPPALQRAATNFYCIGWCQQDPARQGPQTDCVECSAHREPSLTTSELLRSRMVQLIREITETHGEVTIGVLEQLSMNGTRSSVLIETASHHRPAHPIHSCARRFRCRLAVIQALRLPCSSALMPAQARLP